MKDVFTHKKIIKVVGVLTEDFNGDKIIEVYESKDEPPTVVKLDALIADIMEKQIQIICEEDI